jgi:hypothetical protein
VIALHNDNIGPRFYQQKVAHPAARPPIGWRAATLLGGKLGGKTLHKSTTLHGFLAFTHGLLKNY